MACAISFGDANAGFQAGIVNGSVNTSFHLPPERRETPPSPDIVIPFDRDTKFVERGTIFEQVHQGYIATGSRVALVGLGGVGKSQLAIEYAYRTRKQSPDTWVFWVHASNAARFEQSYRDIAGRVKIAGRLDPQANIFQLVHDWLCDCKQRWLLVLDNVDDARFLIDVQATGRGQGVDLKSAARPLLDYFPHCKHGSILVTTRSREAALKLVEQCGIVPVEPMDKGEALVLFEKKLGVQEDSSDVAELAAALDYMPLAIVQAAAYISRRAPRCSVVQYLEEFRRSDGEKTSLLNHEAGYLRRDREAKNSIITTWEISFEHLRRDKPSAADLLSLMSFFDRQGIPEALIHRVQGGKGERTSSDRETSTRQRLKHFFSHTKSTPKIQQEHRVSDRDRVKFEDDVTALCDLCLISISADRVTFEMHSLVQLATRRWLIANGKLKQWGQHFISNLCAAFPTGQYENWEACQALFAHAKAAASQKPEAESSLVEWATLLYRAAWYAESKGSAGEAETLAVQSMNVRKEVLGGAHQDTVSSIAMVADAYSLGGRWDDAEKLMAQVMKIRKKKLGADHPSTLTSMANLASTYRNQGRWDAAEELEVQVIETRKKKLGADHPSMLTSMANLASTYRNQGRWDAAEELFVQVMETSKKKLGADHPDTLTSMKNLAYTQRSLGQEVEAIKLMRECVQLSQQRFRPNHPNLLSSSAALAQWEAEPAVANLDVALLGQR